MASHEQGLGRGAFIAASILSTVLVIIVASISVSNVVPIDDGGNASENMLYFALPWVVGFVCMMVIVPTRVRDFGGNSAVFVTLMLVPVVNFFVWIYLASKSGRESVIAAAKQEKLRKQWEKEARNIK